MLRSFEGFSLIMMSISPSEISKWDIVLTNILNPSFRMGFTGWPISLDRMQCLAPTYLIDSTITRGSSLCLRWVHGVNECSIDLSRNYSPRKIVNVSATFYYDSNVFWCFFRGFRGILHHFCIKTQLRLRSNDKYYISVWLLNLT